MRSSWRIDCILALIIWIQLVWAAPAEHDTSSAISSTPPSTHISTSSIHSESRASVSSDVDASPTQSSHPVIPASPNDADGTTPTSTHHKTSSHSLVIPHTPTRTPYQSWPHPHTTASHAHPFMPSTPIPSSTRSSAHGQPVVAIVFEVLAGAAGLFIVLALARCLYSYKRTPARDRIGALLNRHRLEREMEEMERDRMARISRALEPYRWRPPPPPYQHAPEYDSVVNTDSSIDWGRPTQPVPSHSPPPRSPPPPPPLPP
ncbi:hypothetical protein GSI_01019 [Ganoderma sinense ZZ0214-1]|uniref:Transporter n=1 Tax=Ganoderma sinense ZZ0214-1 TaxID=1077348 RepID=A0A2G8SU72_9APHY|nr:hypothetical protein GSI_01019 [Ganoderma sinense ZZ0214-1]